jgi:hypothetical protein
VPFLDALRTEAVAQGDVVDGIEYRVPGLGPASGLVLVVSHSCEYTKAAENQPLRPLLISPVVGLVELPDGQGGLVARGQVARYWPLPTNGPLTPCAADFASIQPVLASELLDGTRIASMDENGQHLLVARLLEFLSNREFAA